MNGCKYLVDKYSGKIAPLPSILFFFCQYAPLPLIPKAFARLLSEKTLVPSSKTAQEIINPFKSTSPGYFAFGKLNLVID
ncbi:hypothetical protein ES705_10406 [subsurface metagenome]